MKWSLHVFAAPLVSVVFGVGCDKEPTKVEQMVQAAASASHAGASAPAVLPPRAPTIAVDDTALIINGERGELAGPDPLGRLVALVSGKPLVAGEDVTLEASRDAKMAKVALAISVLRRAKAKGITLQTPTRDKIMGHLIVAPSTSARTNCSAVAAVGKDYSISVWQAGGGGAQRFSKGFAGPDVTLGSEALRKASAACDSSLWFLGAEDSIPWGLVFDLAMAAESGASEGGVGLRATQTAIVLDAPVAGRKLPEEP